MKLVIIESPFSGNLQAATSYLQDCLRHSLMRGEAPFASHAIYAQHGVLDDKKPNERELGIQAGFAWGAKADLVAVYTDLGVSDGMRQGIAAAKARGTPVEFRSLDAEDV